MRRNALLLVAVLLVVALLPATARATHVQCGDVLTADTRLDSDLQCSFLPEGEGTALTIAAAGVTLDLAGHTVSGPPFFSDTAGVAAAGVDGIVVRNGTVRSFNADILLSDVSDSLVRDIRIATISVSGNGNSVRSNREVSGIGVSGDRNKITHNAIASGLSFDNRTWLSLAGADNLIAHNVLTGVSPSSADIEGVGMRLRLHGGLVAHNVVTAAETWSGDFLTGIELTGDGAVVHKNVASGHVDAFALFGPFTLTDNTALANRDDGIDVDVSGSTLTRNLANDNGDLGIEAVPATIDGGGNRAAGNGNPAQCTGVSCR